MSGTTKTIFVNHTETILIPDGFYVSTDYEAIMSNYFINALAPTKGTIVADLSSDNITYMPRAATIQTAAPGQLLYEDASTNQLNFNGLKFLVLEVSDLSSKTIIRSRESTDTIPPIPTTITEPSYRAFYGSYATNYEYSPNFWFKLDFNVQEDKSFTEYYKEGGVFVRNITYETRTIDGQPVQVMVDPRQTAPNARLRQPRASI